LVLGAIADELDDQGKDRHRQHEGGEEEVELRRDPDRHPAADLRELAILDLLVGLLLVALLHLGLLVGDPLRPRGLLRHPGRRAIGRVVLAAQQECGDADDHRETEQRGEEGGEALLHHDFTCWGFTGWGVAGWGGTGWGGADAGGAGWT